MVRIVILLHDCGADHVPPSRLCLRPVADDVILDYCNPQCLAVPLYITTLSLFLFSTAPETKGNGERMLQVG